MTEFLRVKNWREHQHYKNREAPPPWIKLYRKILTDYDFRGLADADKFKLVALWLLASDKDGTVPNDPRYVADCIGVKRIDLDLFVSRGFLERIYNDSRANLDTEELDLKKREDRAVKKQPSDTSLEEVRNIVHAQFGGSA